MNETCDRCGPAVGAVYRAGSTGERYLCLHCGNRLGPALHARGWTMSPVSERWLPAGPLVGVCVRPAGRWPAAGEGGA